MSELETGLDVKPAVGNRSASLAALAAAKARAQVKFKPLGKDKEASVFSKRTGSTYTYTYADLAACLESVIPALSDEGIALFQPVRVEAASAIATTFLVHGESGEWISSDYAAPVADPSDARSVGSAATYARRYGLLSMLAIASADEDDDAEQARGGAHEMLSPSSNKACPACGTVGAIIKGSPQYGGGWVCWAKRGGCGVKWPEGPFPTEAPPLDTEPSRKPIEAPALPKRGQGRAPKEAQAEGRAPEPGPKAVNPADARQSALGSGADTQASGPGEAQDQSEGKAATAAPHQPVQGPDEAPPAPIPTAGTAESHTFELAGNTYTTKGLTREQALSSFKLCPAYDKLKGKGASRALLMKMFSVQSRSELTETQGVAYLAAMEKALA